MKKRYEDMNPIERAEYDLKMAEKAERNSTIALVVCFVLLGLVLFGMLPLS
ncbi:MAG: hypothetical protein LUE63_06580 [Lachnospiraceae bacterium]|nr:hypothetical protein [Lachnospiraceae bacterium]